MKFPLPIPPPLQAAVRPGTGVLLALSGGVDSSVALALLASLGCQVYAVTFKNFCYGDETTTGERACCSAEAIADAQRIAHRFGARHWVTDVSALFQREVIEPFVAAYSAGRTPNPCLTCNERVRFPELVRMTRQLGLELAATGHYSRILHEDGCCRLARGVDSKKDQSYFLYGVERTLLPRLLFPLGWYRKEEVRQAASALALPVAAKPESQEICFVPDGDRSFLFAGAEAATGGDIIDRHGSVLGQHRGLVHYTVGQRRGLGIATGQPLYVLALDRERNRLVVGPAPELAVSRIQCDRFIATVEDFPEQGPPTEVPGFWMARIRHGHQGAPVADWCRAGQELSVTLDGSAAGVAPGQALVLYHDDIVLGGGRIRQTA